MTPALLRPNPIGGTMSKSTGKRQTATYQSTLARVDAIIRILAKHGGTCQDKSGFATSLLGSQLPKDLQYEGTIGMNWFLKTHLEEPGLIFKSTNGKRTYLIGLTQAGWVKARQLGVEQTKAPLTQSGVITAKVAAIAAGQQHVTCDLCGKHMHKASLRRHRNSTTCQERQSLMQLAEQRGGVSEQVASVPAEAPVLAQEATEQAGGGIDYATLADQLLEKVLARAAAPVPAPAPVSAEDKVSGTKIRRLVEENDSLRASEREANRLYQAKAEECRRYKDQFDQASKNNDVLVKRMQAMQSELDRLKPKRAEATNGTPLGRQARVSPEAQALLDQLRKGGK